MNKKLLAAAVAVAVASPAAFAESTVYGKMHASIDAIDYDTTSTDNYEVNSRASRLGFKGSEDLGNGLKAIYQIELGIDINSSGADGQAGASNGNGIFGSKTRNTFVGLSGDFGTFIVGRHDTPAKMAFYAAGTEMLGDSVIDLSLGNDLSGAANPNQPIGVFHEYRADDAIAYVSPNFSGFTVAAAIIPGEDSGTSTTTPSVAGVFTNLPGTTVGTIPASSCKNQRDSIADHYSVGLMYKGNGLQAGAGYSSYDLDQCGGNSNLDDYEVMQIGASYTMNNFKFGAHYEDSSNVGGMNNLDYTAWGVVGKATFGNNAVAVVYTDAELDAPSSSSMGDVDRDGWGISAEHNFSKRTKVYAAYAAGTVDYSSSSESDDDNDVFSLGMVHNF
jgi:predicted porin